MSYWRVDKFLTETFALGRTFPEESVTVPESVALASCAHTLCSKCGEQVRRCPGFRIQRQCWTNSWSNMVYIAVAIRCRPDVVSIVAFSRSRRVTPFPLHHSIAQIWQRRSAMMPIRVGNPLTGCSWNPTLSPSAR